jgi:hypothetical protein
MCISYLIYIYQIIALSFWDYHTYDYHIGDGAPFLSVDRLNRRRIRKNCTWLCGDISPRDGAHF